MDNGYLSLTPGGKKCLKCPEGKFVTVNRTCGTCPVGHRVRNGVCVQCINSISAGGSIGYCKLCLGGTKPNAKLSACV